MNMYIFLPITTLLISNFLSLSLFRSALARRSFQRLSVADGEFDSVGVRWSIDVDLVKSLVGHL